jgi:nucleoid DNA-binding protein
MGTDNSKPRFFNYDAYRAVMEYSNAKGTDKFVLATLATYVNTTIRAAWPSAETLAADTGLTERTVRESIKALLASGELILDADSKVQIKALGKSYEVKTRVFRLSVLEQTGRIFRPVVHYTPEDSSGHTPEDSSDNKKTPEKKNKTAPSALAGRENPIWDAVVTAQYGDSKPQLTKSQCSDIGKTVAELKAAGATPDQIQQARKRWSQLFPGATFTHRCLRQHWAQLVSTSVPLIDPSAYWSDDDE